MFMDGMPLHGYSKEFGGAAVLVGMVLLQAAVVGGIGFAFGTAFAAAFFQFATRPDSELRGMNLPWWIVGVVAVLMVSESPQARLSELQV